MTTPLDSVSNELSSRRTGMSFQRTRMSADRTLMSVIRTSLSLISFGFTIHKVFQNLYDSHVLTEGDGATRNFGTTLVGLGILMLIVGIVYHCRFMLELRRERQEMVKGGLLHGDGKFPPSFTLVTAIILLVIGIAGIVGLVFKVGPLS